MNLKRTVLRSILSVVGLSGLMAATVGACTAVVSTSSYKEGCESLGKKKCEIAPNEFVCVDTGDRDYGCAQPTCVPCNLPHAQAACANDGTCAIGACSGTFKNCDMSKENGCEIDTDSDIANCGGCANATIGIIGTDCRTKLAAAMSLHVQSVKCALAQCKVDKCQPLFLDCMNTGLADGCETPVSASNCGSCGRTCAAPTTCDLATGTCK